MNRAYIGFVMLMLVLAGCAQSTPIEKKMVSKPSPAETGTEQPHEEQTPITTEAGVVAGETQAPDEDGIPEVPNDLVEDNPDLGSLSDIAASTEDIS